MVILTPKQQQIYDFIVYYQKKYGYPPSIREIGDGIGLKSPATVHAHVKNLIKHGVLTKDSLKNRALKINENYDNIIENNNSNEGIDFINVPVLGKVTAGQPILAIENIERTIPLPMDFARNKDLFMLKVSGESMINVGILDGDFIITEKTPFAQNGDKVVALIDDSATVKTFYKEKGYFRLQPENDYMEPIIVNEVTILGKVVGVIRMY